MKKAINLKTNLINNVLNTVVFIFAIFITFNIFFILSTQSQNSKVSSMNMEIKKYQKEISLNNHNIDKNDFIIGVSFIVSGSDATVGVSTSSR